jgi:hypothetical protein
MDSGRGVVEGGLPEATLNRLLRRIDWRFLLTDPRPPTTLVSATPSLASAIAGVGGPGLVAVGEVRLAVMSDPTRDELEQAFDRLEAGGSCYCEWTRMGRGGPSSVGRRLRAAGFTGVTTYWPWPSPDRMSPEVWLPLDAPGAIDWFLASRGESGPRLQRARAAVARTAWRAAHRVGALRPVCTVAVRPGGDTAPWLTRFVADCPTPGLSAPSSWMLKTGGRRAINKVVALGFREGEREPAIVVKVARLRDAEDALGSEMTNLRALHSACPGGVDGAPRLLKGSKAGDSVAVAESFEGGIPLMADLRPETHRSFALAVTDWLVDLARATRTPVPDWRTRLVEEPLVAFAQRYGAVIENGALKETRDRLSLLRGVAGAFEQRDCAPWNILRRADGGIVVLDWESAEPRGLPVLDLVYYLTFSSLALEGAIERESEKAYRASRDRSTFLGDVAAESEARYLTALGLEARCLDSFRLLTWIVHARGEYDRIASDCGGPPSASALHGAMFLRLWRAELECGDVERPTSTVTAGSD